ncbi:hypothetical protein ACOMHN_009318 [Nucella lapillus]
MTAAPAEGLKRPGETGLPTLVSTASYARRPPLYRASSAEVRLACRRWYPRPHRPDGPPLYRASSAERYVAANDGKSTSSKCSSNS